MHVFVKLLKENIQCKRKYVPVPAGGACPNSTPSLFNFVICGYDFRVWPDEKISNFYFTRRICPSRTRALSPRDYTGVWFLTCFFPSYCCRTAPELCLESFFVLSACLYDDFVFVAFVLNFELLSVFRVTDRLLLLMRSKAPNIYTIN